MKKIFLTLAVLVCCSFVSTLSAQEGRNARVTIGMNNLNYTIKEQKANVGTVLGAIVGAMAGKVTNQQDGYQDAVRASIVKGISQARRVSAIDGKLSEEEISHGNACYIDATVSNISTTSQTETYDKKTTTSYKGIIGLTLHIKDATNDEIIASPTFNISEYDVSWVETAEGALNKALESLAKKVTVYFNKWLPLSANIIEGAREKKDKQKEVYIDLGSSEGAVEGLHFGVFTFKTIAGKEAKKQIGKLKIMEVEGDEISLCKVQSGGREIKEAIDAGVTLKILSLD